MKLKNDYIDTVRNAVTHHQARQYEITIRGYMNLYNIVPENYDRVYELAQFYVGKKSLEGVSGHGANDILKEFCINQLPKQNFDDTISKLVEEDNA